MAEVGRRLFKSMLWDHMLYCRLLNRTICLILFDSNKVLGCTQRILRGR